MDQGVGRIPGEDREGAGEDRGDGERRCVSQHDCARDRGQWRECKYCRQGDEGKNVGTSLLLCVLGAA